jgi:hypothetical protein
MVVLVEALCCAPTIYDLGVLDSNFSTLVLLVNVAGPPPQCRATRRVHIMHCCVLLLFDRTLDSWPPSLPNDPFVHTLNARAASAPTNNVFATLPQKYVDFLLLLEIVEQLQAILLYHFWNGTTLSSDIVPGPV